MTEQNQGKKKMDRLVEQIKNVTKEELGITPSEDQIRKHLVYDHGLDLKASRPPWLFRMLMAVLGIDQGNPTDEG